MNAPLDVVLAGGATGDALRDALWQHQVLVFPGLNPTPGQHHQLAEIFGKPQPPQPQNVSHPDYETITVFDSEGGYKADQWHADATFGAEVPLGAVLCMRENPAVGGDTMWASAYAAYDTLSGGMKKLLDGRRAVHEIAPGLSHEHPVVISHPETQRPVLFVNKIFTRRLTNLPLEESNAILPFLLNHLTRPEFTFRHRWDDGDVVIWDNWSTQHYALFDFAERRVVHRISLDGQALAAAPLSAAG